MTFNKYRKIIRQIRNISLSIDDRQSMREDFMKKSGIGAELAGDISNPLSNQWGSLVYKVAFAVAVLFFVVSPLAYAMEISLPGDILYPAKTAILDPIRRVINNNVLQKNSAVFELDLLEEKIVETENIFERDELDENRKSKAKEVIQKQVEQVKKNDDAENILQRVADKADLNTSIKTSKTEQKNQDKKSEKDEDVGVKITDVGPVIDKEIKNIEKKQELGTVFEAEDAKEIKSELPNKELEDVLDRHRVILEKIEFPMK